MTKRTPGAEATWLMPALSPHPLPGGTLFRVVSSAPTISLLLYDEDHASPRVVPLHPERHRRDGLWEIFVPGVASGTRYNWSVHPDRPLVDPYALEVDGPTGFGVDAARPRATYPRLNEDHRFAGIVRAPLASVAWNRPQHDRSDLVVYELHVRGYTRHPSAEANAPGGFRGLTEKIPYLVDLGITAVELLPVHTFDDGEVQHAPGLVNYWGYSPINWFAPNARYGTIDDFRFLVTEFHKAGIEVWIDVVYNHTAEMDESGPTWSLRDLDPDRYYLGDDHTGCGNTVRTGEPTVRRLIVQSLRWWHRVLGVDGFRFDLASVLARDADGQPSDAPSLIAEMESDPWLSHARFIAEAWDATGDYRVSTWPGDARWLVWNDRFRDDVRRAWLTGAHDRIGHRLAGSPDLWDDAARSLNFVTAHDGFTLRDLVSYQRRHNESNGEDNRDGHAHEPSRNFGAEGPTDDRTIVRTRDATRRAIVASLLLADGVPMLTAGDEFGRSQDGNNNAYCHDHDGVWIDWSQAEKDHAFRRFVRALIRIRGAAIRGDAERTWFGPGDGLFAYATDNVLVALNLRETQETLDLSNAGDLPYADWRRIVDTAAAPPNDVLDTPEPIAGSLGMAPRSLVVAIR